MERTISYGYHAVGNRSQKTENGLPTSYTVNLLNQYEAFSYDANGNLTTHAGWTLTYDAQNRMVEASNPSSVIRFQYDARNRCVSRTINGITTYFAYDGWNLIEDHDASGNVLARYYHGAVVDELIARATPSETVYYHQDALGSTTHLTDSTGNIVESYRYDAFGSPLSVSAVGNRFLFTGREWLSELNLYDYRHRLYSPSLGRFLQTDPIRFMAGDIDLYRYCFNNPLGYYDPFGLCSTVVEKTKEVLKAVSDYIKNKFSGMVEDVVMPPGSGQQKVGCEMAKRRQCEDCEMNYPIDQGNNDAYLKCLAEAEKEYVKCIGSLPQKDSPQKPTPPIEFPDQTRPPNPLPIPPSKD